MPTKKPMPKKAAPAKKGKEAVKPLAKNAKKATEKDETKATSKADVNSKKSKVAASAKAVKPAAEPIKKAAPKKKTAPTTKKPVQAEQVKPAKAKKSEKESKAEAKSKKSPTSSKLASKSKESINGTKPKASKVKEEPVKEIKVPKTTVKTSVPYVPGYTPMEKRKENDKPNEPLVRYSDNDLNEFRNLINKKLESAKKELSYLQGLITRKDDMGGDEADNRYMTMEDGSISMEREQLSQMASRQLTFIDHLEKSLIRIENKTYGICRVTGRLIEKPRLLAVPHATLSLEAKLGIVKPNE